MDWDLFVYQQQQQCSGLTRYSSAPSTFFVNLMDDNNSLEEFLNDESETMFANFLSVGGSENSEHCDPNEVNQGNVHPFSTSVKQEVEDFLVQQNQCSADACTQFLNEVSPVRSASAAGSHVTAMENPKQVSPNIGNLIRHQSSPAGLFSGFTVPKNERNPVAGSRIQDKNITSMNGLNSYMSFSRGHSSGTMPMPQLTEKDDSTYAGLKGYRDGDMKAFSTNGFDTQSGHPRQQTTGLIHHLSMPKTSSERIAAEKYLQFQQDSVPCKIRAKRGCATHPRSIAERMRRTRISERIRKLQELFPVMDKQTTTADMLDMAVEHIKKLQKQLQELEDTKAKCTCSS